MDIILNENETLTEINESLKLIQNPCGLTFGTDALLLASFVKKNSSDIGVELGAGTGVVSLLCASRKKLKRIFAVEIQPEYADICRRNVELNGLSDTITTVEGDVRERILKEYEGSCSVVFSNPPYMTTDSGYRNTDDGKYAARHEVNGTIASFCKCASSLLKFGGTFLCVYRHDRLIDLICAMRDNAIEPKKITIVYPDQNHEPCLVLVEGKRGGKPSLCIPAPLFIYKNGTTEYTDEMKYIYDNGEIENVKRK